MCRVTFGMLKLALPFHSKSSLDRLVLQPLDPGRIQYRQGSAHLRYKEIDMNSAQFVIQFSFCPPGSIHSIWGCFKKCVCSSFFYLPESTDGSVTHPTVLFISDHIFNFLPSFLWDATLSSAGLPN